jgi:hypothetical protein
VVNNEIGLYELSEYAFAYDVLPKLKVEKAAVIESMYADCVPTTTQLDPDLGRWVAVSVNVEKMAIAIIERKEDYDRMIERYDGKAKVFEQAMYRLTDRERQVIQAQYFHRVNDLGLSPDYFSTLLHDAQEKLCYSICELQQNQSELRNAEERQAVKDRVVEWKQAI